MIDKKELHTQRYTYWYWNDVYSHDELLELHKIFEKNGEKFIKDSPASNAVKISKLKMSRWFHLKNKLYNIEQALFQVNSENFGYNIWPQYDSQFVILNEYDSKVKGEYGWHNDSNNNHINDMKFTLLINASLEPYKGGEFNLFDSNGGEHLKQFDKPGNVIAFISHNYHKVTPVTSGKRHSITLFYSGPKFI